MIIEFNKRSNFYDDLKKKLYNSEFEEIVRYNFIPIKIYGEKYILTSSKNLEGYLMDYNKDVKVKLYIKDNYINNDNDNNIECISLQLTNIVVFGAHQSNINENQTSPDCYIDLMCDLLLIKFNSSKLNYIKINNNLNSDEDIRYDEEIINLKYNWMDGNFEVKSMIKRCKIINMWNDKYINLPPIPLMLNVENNECKPFTGSGVFDDCNNLLGMVAYFDTDEIMIIPLISIKKICDNLFDYKILYLGIDLVPIKYNFKLGLNNINYTNGLLITNNYYDNLLNDKKKIRRKIQKNKNNKIDDDSLNTKNLAEELKLLLVDEKKQDLTQNYYDKLSVYNLELKNLIKKNNSIQITSVYSNLKKGNIICSIDDYKINSCGNIIIGEYKTIPLKSYIWLFKNSRNNTINLKNISPQNYRGELINSQDENEELFIDDSSIKKQVNVKESLIPIKSEYDTISVFGLSQLKYMTYNFNSNSTSIELIEVNEKMLEIIKQFLISNQRTYYDIINYIFSEKYTSVNNKMLLIFNFNKRRLPTIKIISNDIATNYDYILDKYKSNKELKDFLILQA